jgi:hypothetical protein
MARQSFCQCRSEDDFRTRGPTSNRRGQKFKQAILAAKYHRDTDRVELVTPWCILIVDRDKIEELRELSPDEMETITVSTVGLHIERADVDINSAGLITDISRQLASEVTKSF